ncbi:MAG: galactitol-1-phosphate 5-dehydrogenase [Verrucomicrobiae bacterium]|nr:galactitol-1-phosphate 5-dehydrogenase [Verrucomicrobiae bacterium]MCB1086599.1 galactitol-1-phosphate 5-dehydrogenase [Verrucomicrobiae bacterium]
MKALTLTAYHQFEFGDSPDPEIGPEDVLISVKACGICGSDIHGMDGSSGRRQPPIIMGHEAAGEISRVGSAVTNWQPGDRVTFDSTVYCGKCPACLSGQVNLCPNRNVLGVSCGDYRRHGAFAEFVAVPQHILYRIPEGIPFEQAAFAEPISIALHGVNRVPLKPGDSAVVVGAGLIGLLVVQALKAKGAGMVIAVDIDEKRLALARKLGADHTLLSGDDVPAKVRELVGNEDGADVAMEVVGFGPTMKIAVESVRKGGSIGCVGNLKAEVPFPLQAVVTRELSVFGSCASAGEYAEAVKAVANGSIKVEPLISAVADLKDGADWFNRLYKNEEGLMKVILTP